LNRDDDARKFRSLRVIRAGVDRGECQVSITDEETRAGAALRLHSELVYEYRRGFASRASPTSRQRDGNSCRRSSRVRSP
jgi:hypothetical protein